MEPMKKDLIKQKPRRSSEFLVSKKVLFKIIIEGLLIAFFTILSYYMGLKVNSSCAKTCVFLTLCSARLFHGFNCRGEKSIFSEKIKNKAKFYIALVILSLTGQIAWVVENMYFNVFIYKEQVERLVPFFDNFFR